MGSKMKMRLGNKMKIVIHQCHNKHFSLISKLIELNQKTGYSHVAIEYQSETGRKLIVDSTRKNISIYPYDKYFANKYDTVGQVEIELDCTRIGFLKIIEDWLGQDYPEEQILGLLLGIAFVHNGSKKMTCNELALRICLELKKGFKFDGNLDAVDLNEAWKALNG